MLKTTVSGLGYARLQQHTPLRITGDPMKWTAAAREELRDCINAIEREADEGRYQPGPWQGALRAARALAQSERAALASEISRVSAKLHCRKGVFRASLMAGLAAEIAGALAGAVLLVLTVHRHSNALAILAALTWIATLEPLIKVATGYLLGIEYDYVYLAGIEPRFKMRYGDYVAARRWARIALHLSGTVGAPLAAWLVAASVGEELRLAVEVCRAMFWVFVAINGALFLAALFGVRRVGPLRLANSSGGAAAMELREALEI